MITYQDLLAINQNNEDEKIDFVQSIIQTHKTSDIYKTAVVADEYNRRQNRTIVQFQKLLYSLSGKAIPDNTSANYKLASNFFYRFVVQENQYLLGNGVTWKNGNAEGKLGSDFDFKLQQAGLYALVGGVSFGFYNNDHLETFKVQEFAPLWDEETGALMAGVRFWQIDLQKPMRATLYELDGYTEYIWNRREPDGTTHSKGEVLNPKRPYKIIKKTTGIDGTEIMAGENYPSFPIVPLWGNPNHQSDFVGLREQIDAYDLIKSGFCNTVDEGSIIYWLVQGAGGMDDFDLTEFLDRIRRVHAAAPQEGQSVEAHTIEPPYQSRETLLDRLSADMYRDAMALDTDKIAGGAVTATQIKAAYEPLNNKVDQYEYCVLDFLRGIMELAGIDDEPSFTRSMLVNAQETAQTVLQSAEYLSRDYVTAKVLTLLGDGDKLEEVLNQMAEDDTERISYEITERENTQDGAGEEDAASEETSNGEGQ